MGTVMRSGVTAGWGATGDRHVILTGTGYRPGVKQGAIYCPAFGAGAANVTGTAIAGVLAQWGHPVVACDLGASRAGQVAGAASVWLGTGPHLWSADTALGGLDTIRDTIMPAIGGLAPYLVFFGSAGGAPGMVWAHDNPDDVAACLGVIATVDVEDIRANNRGPESQPGGGYQASIEAALGAGPVPAAKNPAELGATWPDAVPMRHYYSAGDTTCIPQATLDLVEAINDGGGTADAIAHNALDHNYLNGLPVQEAAGWLARQTT